MVNIKKMFIGQYSSSTSPIDTTQVWTNEAKNSQTYFYDGADWVSSILYSASFTKRGRLNNNSFLKIGDVDCDHDKKGFIEESEIKIVKANMIKSSNGTGTMNVISNGVSIDSFGITSATINTVASTGTPKVTASTHISLQWGGAKISDPVVSLYYRKVA